MARNEYLFTSESVSEGHPDKVCDQISDGIVDMILAREPEARIAVETAATTNKVVLMGEIKVSPDNAVSESEMIESARDTIRKIGYMQKGFHFKTASIDCYVHEQSADIAQGVDASDNKDEGAGDQGIMFGFATDETPELMPAPILYSHRILRLMAEARHSDQASLFGPDAKSQVTIEYRDGKPARAHTIVVSSQHLERDAAGREITSGYMRELVEPFVREALPEGFIDAKTVWHVNPTGRFVIGGPDGDAGLTGRKIIVDTYGGAAPHGGGAFSGKDPTKVDRSAAYAARYIAKNVVAAGLASKCTIQLAYAIGVAEPLALYVDGHGTETEDPAKIEAAIREVMSLTPRGIRTRLGLNRPIYQRTASYGHFGREPEGDGGFSWEKLDLAAALKGAL
ncbi:methionine adenosyltransferase [Limibaculum sp. M0105]|uniref:S-adenosylmethionine synthase n=1 Tax=Thermohalobaculum xanthum TaxID=2753746 RepID=A0A8J7M918_9RHOB|nr:methionine adenosyltransferase [Thermohalobaculum xanthum]MBK0400909.1 methionine adenosyltransferase [Thermohalobaculum xanthum]